MRKFELEALMSHGLEIHECFALVSVGYDLLDFYYVLYHHKEKPSARQALEILIELSQKISVEKFKAVVSKDYRNTEKKDIEDLLGEAHG